MKSTFKTETQIAAQDEIPNTVEPQPLHDQADSTWPIFKSLARGGAAVAAAAASSGCPPNQPFMPADPYPDVVPPKLHDTLRRLVDRMTFGLNAREADLVRALGHDNYIEYHLNYESIDDTALETRLQEYRTLGLSPRELALRERLSDLSHVEEFFTATYLRSAYSTRQLYERMVAFWTNHFSTYLGKQALEILKPVDDREVVRPFALGHFPDLLSASAHSPAMLHYLDNTTSVAEAPNQNYARELLELHTVGPENFTQTDMEEVARCFTGWTVNSNFSSPNLGRFQFVPEMHDNGAKFVLGHGIPAGGGVRDGEIVLEILTTDAAIAPLTANFIARKIAVEFHGYDPPMTLIADMANTFLRTRGDIRAMLRVVLARQWIEAAPPKLKRPYHLVMSALRARPSNITKSADVSRALGIMEHIPYTWIPPNGFPDNADYWGGNILSRWNFGTLFVEQTRAAPVDWTPFMGDLTKDELLDQIDTYFFGHTMPSDMRTVLADFLAAEPDNFFHRMQAIGLAIDAPPFQWY